jgi:hypothetical protein
MTARTPMTHAFQAIAVMPLKLSTHGARKRRTPRINGRYSTVGFHRKRIRRATVADRPLSVG